MVSGGGTIGLVTAAAAIGMGARVIVVDPVPLRRDIAKRLGADATVDPSAGDPGEAVRELTDGGADLVVEASGHSASLASVFDYARPEGRISMVGINIGNKIPVELGKIQMKNLTVRGCIGSPGVWPAAIRFLERTGIDLSPIQTHSFPLDNAVDGAGAGQEADGSGQSDTGDCVTISTRPYFGGPEHPDRSRAVALLMKLQPDEWSSTDHEHLLGRRRVFRSCCRGSL